MYYATIDNGLGKGADLPDGAIGITKQEYRELLEEKAKGKKITVDNGQYVTYTKCYAEDGSELAERNPVKPFITEAPTEEFQVPVWSGGQWTEGETAQEKADREEAEIEAARVAKLSELKSAHDESLAPLKSGCSDFEIMTWDKQEREARAYVANSQADTPFIDGLAASRGMDKAELASRIIAKADIANEALKSAIGHRQALEDQVVAAETLAEIEAIEW